MGRKGVTIHTIRPPGSKQKTLKTSDKIVTKKKPSLGSPKLLDFSKTRFNQPATRHSEDKFTSY